MGDNGLTGCLNTAEERSFVVKRLGQASIKWVWAWGGLVFQGLALLLATGRTLGGGKWGILIASGTGAVGEEQWFWC